MYTHTRIYAQAKVGMPRPTLFMGTGTESRRAQGLVDP